MDVKNVFNVFLLIALFHPANVYNLKHDGKDSVKN
jgi:hypothetical protein